MRIELADMNLNCSNILTTNFILFLSRSWGNGDSHLPANCSLEQHSAALEDKQKYLERARTLVTQPAPRCVQSQGEVQRISRQNNIVFF